MLLVVISNVDTLSGKLTTIFTGCPAYHTAWVDDERGVMYDMYFLRRRRPWPQQYRGNQIKAKRFTSVTREYLEDRLTQDNRVYGFLDYLLFGLRPVFHLFGRSTRNAGGVICSEMVNEDLQACGYKTPWPLESPPPSPCDISAWLDLLPDSNLVLDFQV